MPRLTYFLQRAALIAGAVALAACTTAPPQPGPVAPESTSSTSSKYYKDDGPGGTPPVNLEQIPDATPRVEPINRFASRPYTVLGRDYVPATSLRAYRERGIASWYGRKFHGQKTAIGETYDMYAMTAAHPTLPLPSYVRVTSVVSGKSVVVRVNDRGPFLHGRIIDLSYAAADRIGIASRGSGEVEIETFLTGNTAVLAQAPASAGTLPPAARTPSSPSSSDAVVTTPLRSVDTPLPTAIAGDAPQAAGAVPTVAARDVIARDSAGAPVVSITREIARSLSQPAAASPQPANASPPARDTRGAAFAVQLGAFQNSINAQNFLAHVQGQLASAQVEPKVREANGLYRVYVGPYSDREEARRVADRITTAFGVPAAIAVH